MRVKLLPSLFAAMLNAGLPSAAHAQAASEWIRDPLPSELQERAAKLLHTVRPRDADAALAAVKIIDGRIWREHGVLLLRVEADCQSGQCMTIIGRVTDREIVPELTLRAGKMVIFADWGRRWWGADEVSFPIFFQGTQRAGIAAISRDGAWVVDACGECFEASEPVPKPLQPAPPPSGTPPKETFDDFQRAIGLADEP